jgi:hypothetical protein
MKRVLIVVSLFAAMTAGVLIVMPSMSVVPSAEAAGCICPKIYAPVICDHGNQTVQVSSLQALPARG